MESISFALRNTFSGGERQVGDTSRRRTKTIDFAGLVNCRLSVSVYYCAKHQNLLCGTGGFFRDLIICKISAVVTVPLNGCTYQISTVGHGDCRLLPRGVTWG